MSTKNEYIPEDIDHELVSGEIVQKNESTELEIYEGEFTDDNEKEIEDAKNTLRKLRDTGLNAVDYAYGLMEATEHPRAIETFSGLLKNVAEITKDLVDVQKSKKDLIASPKDDQNSAKNVQNNTIFVGSTEDLRKLLKEK